MSRVGNMAWPPTMVVGSFMAISEWLLPWAAALEAPARATSRRARVVLVVLGMTSVSHGAGEVELCHTYAWEALSDLTRPATAGRARDRAAVDGWSRSPARSRALDLRARRRQSSRWPACSLPPQGPWARSTRHPRGTTSTGPVGPAALPRCGHQ